MSLFRIFKIKGACYLSVTSIQLCCINSSHRLQRLHIFSMQGLLVVLTNYICIMTSVDWRQNFLKLFSPFFLLLIQLKLLYEFRNFHGGKQNFWSKIYHFSKEMCFISSTAEWNFPTCCSNSDANNGTFQQQMSPPKCFEVEMAAFASHSDLLHTTYFKLAGCRFVIRVYRENEINEI